MNLSECFTVLELPESTSPANLKMAYLELVKVWHPDRFPGDSALQARAQEKLKRINIAYKTICDHWESVSPPNQSSPLMPELPSWADWAANLFSKMGQLRKIEIELTSDKLVNDRGETVGGIAFLCRGNRPAKAKLNFTDLASFACPFFCIYIDDLKNSPRKDDNRAVTHWLEVTAKSPEFDASNYARAANGKAALSPEEFLSQYSAEKFERESINRNYKPSSLKDVGAAFKSRWGKPTLDDISRLFQNWFFRNPPT